MNISCCVFLLTVLCSFGTPISARKNDEHGDGLSRFRKNELSCRRQQQGFCRKRSQCKNPSRHACRLGRDPIICCLDRHEPPTTTRKLSISSRRLSVKPESIKEIDLTYPHCGFRQPKIEEGRRQESSNAGNGGLFSRRRGKRASLNLRSNSRRRGKGPRIDPVIVNGAPAVENSWPWMAAILIKINARTPKRFLCGASLISQKYVLSAAHCFDGLMGNIDPPKFFIVVGSHTTQDGTEYAVKNILIHPDYKQRQYYNDISLLELENSVELTKKVYPVCVPSDALRHKILVNNPNVTVIGWGKTSFHGVNSKLLQELTIPIVPVEECNASYSVLRLFPISFPRGITKQFICAGVREGGKGPCEGDSGGPLVSKLKDDSYVQLGVVSFGYGCAQPESPGVYTRVSQYTKWLYDNTDLGKF